MPSIQPISNGSSVRLCVLSVLFLGVTLLAGCPAPAGKSTAKGPVPSPAQPPTEAKGTQLTLWADPVLVKALEGLEPAYRKASRGGSYAVVAIERGALHTWAETGTVSGEASPDVVLFGGEDDYALLRDTQRVAEPTARTFAGDRLLVLKPRDTTYKCNTVFDLYKSRFKELALGDPQATYLGALSDQALKGDGALVRIKDRVKYYRDSRELAQVIKGREDVLAICFASQAGSAAEVEPLLLIDAALHEPIQYRAVAEKGKGEDPAVIAFLRWLAEDSATQQALGGYGLLDRATALGHKAAVIRGGPPSDPAQPITAPPPQEAGAGQ